MKNKQSADLIPAAQYVRMSDDLQQYSIANQKDVIQEYAKRNRFVVVKTYEDSGRSGLTLKQRPGLRKLLQDVEGGDCSYRAILVLDVSRWGRFQNSDEAAYYEFLCTSAGIPLHYCAEQFPNDNTSWSSVLKSLKRTMAAEYSRELSVKVFRGKKRLVQMGFWVGGQAGYGYGRLMLSASGIPKQKMVAGEHKSLTTDRVVLVLGPKKEVQCVREIFAMVIERRMGCTAIARELNQRGVLFYGDTWSNRDVFNLVTNPKYAGCNTWNRGSQKLKSVRVPNRKEDWITKPRAFPPIVDQTTFDRAQKALPKRADFLWSDKELLAKLRWLLAAKGRLSESLINRTRGMPRTTTLHEHFGSYRQIYDLVGYHPPFIDMYRGEQATRTMRLRGELVRQIVGLFPQHVVVSHHPKGTRSMLLVDNDFLVAILFCKMRHRYGQARWEVQPSHLEQDYITLLCLLNPRNDDVESFSICKEINFRFRRVHKDDPWFAMGKHLNNLAMFYKTVKAIHAA